MARRPIEPRIDPHRGDPPTRPGVAADVFREALSRWASTVTVVAVRDGDAVHATTVTSFFPVSADPPLVAVALGPGAQVVPWMDVGATFAVSFLAEGQRGLASRFADSFPVGPSPFPTEGAPVVEGAVAALICTVREIQSTEGGARVVVARVEDARVGDDSPLLYQARSYRRMAPQE
ncbi:MAG: flavin reductase family protein [Gemmatimonadetes bacterium]|nr:flavin reductase family protein [Gemmatimonadota bacterium]